MLLLQTVSLHPDNIVEYTSTAAQHNDNLIHTKTLSRDTVATLRSIRCYCFNETIDYLVHTTLTLRLETAWEMTSLIKRLIALKTAARLKVFLCKCKSPYALYQDFPEEHLRERIKFQPTSLAASYRTRKAWLDATAATELKFFLWYHCLCTTSKRKTMDTYACVA